MNIYESINALLSYGLSHGLIKAADEVYARNMLLSELKLDTFVGERVDKTENSLSLQEILKSILDDAVARSVLGDTITERDLLDTRLMNCLMPRPSEVIDKFYSLYAESPKAATDWYFDLSKSSDYIRTYRVKNDIKWISHTPYGDMDMTINMSKPEKDPRAIKMAALTSKTEKYPKCMLCKENEGYAGRLDHPARENHRMIPIKVAGQDWFMQYSPYVYYNEHAIFLNGEHVPMKIDRQVFVKLLDIIKMLPHYFVGSNAGLPIVGGSILAHEHFQGGRYEFAMAKAPIERYFTLDDFKDVNCGEPDARRNYQPNGQSNTVGEDKSNCRVTCGEPDARRNYQTDELSKSVSKGESQGRVTCGVVRWPMTVIRVNGKSADDVIDACDRILTAWKSYSDPSAYIFAKTEENGVEVEHNTVTPIARMRDGNFDEPDARRNYQPNKQSNMVGEEESNRNGLFEIDLVLRNNITSEEYPDGVFHAHPEYHHIKRENIGLIEVMGLAVLPSRLKAEMEELESAMLSGIDIAADENLKKHAAWVEEIRQKHPQINKDNIDDIIKEEIGVVFYKILENCGVFKRDEKGQKALDKFINSI